MCEQDHLCRTHGPRRLTVVALDTPMAVVCAAIEHQSPARVRVRFTSVAFVRIRTTAVCMAFVKAAIAWGRTP